MCRCFCSFHFSLSFFELCVFELPVRRRLCALALLCFAWPVSCRSVSQSVSRRSAPPASPSAHARAMWRANREGKTGARTDAPAVASASAAATVASSAAPVRPRAPLSEQQPPLRPPAVLPTLPPMARMALPSSASSSQLSTSPARRGATGTQQKQRGTKQSLLLRTDGAPKDAFKHVLVSQPWRWLQWAQTQGNRASS
jgi:hypothetical protein